MKTQDAHVWQQMPLEEPVSLGVARPTLGATAARNQDAHVRYRPVVGAPVYPVTVLLMEAATDAKSPDVQIPPKEVDAQARLGAASLMEDPTDARRSDAQKRQN